MMRKFKRGLCKRKNKKRSNTKIKISHCWLDRSKDGVSCRACLRDQQNNHCILSLSLSVSKQTTKLNYNPIPFPIKKPLKITSDRSNFCWC
ncbi:hypothetical protein RJT34_30317 [Clitoria ternatea]|uniref:Uncharacterized protein n=1 Tax=Clitoria ternatea TaxID=43366 RepID=A0AAN9ESI9_CLITE